MSSRIKQSTLKSFLGIQHHHHHAHKTRGGSSTSPNDNQKQEDLPPPDQHVKHRRNILEWNLNPTKRPRRSLNGSCFGTCPLCATVLPLHRLETHAAHCQGKPTIPPTLTPEEEESGTVTSQECTSSPHNAEKVASAAPSACTPTKSLSPDQATTTTTVIPGLYLFEDFITEDEEAQIIAELDGRVDEYRHEFLPWKVAKFNGLHAGKRWGVHCNLRDRCVSAPEHPLPHFFHTALHPKLVNLAPMAGCNPNEANAIDYHAAQGHYLKSHVDDRQLSKEPIANLSLAGDCYMTFTKVTPQQNRSNTTNGTVVVPPPQQHKILLKRRTLQILTGKARYEFAHGIETCDLLSPRRISVTMRESPLTARKNDTSTQAKLSIASSGAVAASAWWNKTLPIQSPSLIGRLRPTSEPISGLLVFDNFVTPHEGEVILHELDADRRQSWKLETHTGHYREKRFGLDSDLWSRVIRAPKHVMPTFYDQILIPKLRRISVMDGVTPNEGNAIEYLRRAHSWLQAHVDDRRKHKEPIANLSLAGDCYMTFQSTRDSTKQVRVLLQARTLVILTGKARYEYSHGINHEDLLSDRRVSFTMRETA